MVKAAGLRELAAGAPATLVRGDAPGWCLPHCHPDPTPPHAPLQHTTHLLERASHHRALQEGAKGGRRAGKRWTGGSCRKGCVYGNDCRQGSKACKACRSETAPAAAGQARPSHAPRSSWPPLASALPCSRRTATCPWAPSPRRSTAGAPPRCHGQRVEGRECWRQAIPPGQQRLRLLSWSPAQPTAQSLHPTHSNPRIGSQPPDPSHLITHPPTCSLCPRTAI